MHSEDVKDFFAQKKSNKMAKFSDLDLVEKVADDIRIEKEESRTENIMVTSVKLDENAQKEILI